jgi:Tfp pilus assembly protein PilX
MPNRTPKLLVQQLTDTYTFIKEKNSNRAGDILVKMNLPQKPSKNENGLASIVVVGLLIILLTLITIGFARIMNRSVQNATSNETAASASYAAQSGLNDLADYLRTNPNVKSTKCNDLIKDSSGAKGPFYNDVNISGDNNVRLTCLLVNQRPTDLAYQNISNLKSKVVKLTTDTVTGTINSFMFSWQARDPSKNATPNPSVDLIDETSWNNSNYIPMLRVTLYPVTTSGALDDNVQNNSRTYFLVPSNAGGPSSKTFDYLSTPSGTKKRIKCDTSDVPGFTGTADYNCNAVINGLDQVTNIDYYYARITPIYNNIDLKIKGNDIDNRVVKFKNVQAVLDVTAKAGPAAKRLQSRVDIAGIDSSGAVVPSPNTSPDEDNAPDFSLRSANALCKRYKITDDVYDYLTLEGACPTTVCSGPGCGPYTPLPELSMNINTVDSQADTPGGSYVGIDYIGDGGSAQINWNTKDATSCDASGSGWSGSKTGLMAFTPTGLGTGSQTFNGLTNVLDYILTCRGPGSGVSPGVTRTVKAWPMPRVSFNNTTVTAGNSYSLSWTVRNSVSCSAGGAWNGAKSSSVAEATFSENQGTWPWNDNSTKTFTITCRDPSSSGRPVTAQITIGPGRPSNCPAGSCENNLNPPDCTANADIIDRGDGTGQMWWSGTCPNVSPGSGYYQRYSSTQPGWNDASNGLWGVGSGGSVELGAGGPYCIGLRVGADPWGFITDSGAEKCRTIGFPQVRISYFFVDAYDQGPSQCDASVTPAAYAGTWRCRNNRFVVNLNNGCPDGPHRFTTCSANFHSYLDGGSTSGISCRHRSNYGYFGGTYGGGFQNTSGSPTGWGWGGAGSPAPFYLECDGPTPGPGGSGTNRATACYNGGSCGITP